MSGDFNLVKEGKYFAQCQLAKGVKLFGKILGSNIDIEFNETVVEDESEVNVDDNELFEEEVERFDFDFDTIRSIGFETEPNLSTANCVKEDHQLGFTCYLPNHLSQGVISNRNGSNACMVIALLAGYSMLKIAGNQLDDILHLFVGSMELGNVLYEENASTELLNFTEGFDLLPESMHIHCVEESGCIIKENTTIPLHFDVPTFFLLVADEKSYSFLVKEDKVLFSDSHSHPPHGGCISVISLSNFDRFIRKNFENCYINIVVCAC